MKKDKTFRLVPILIVFVVLVFASSCDKSDDQDGDFPSAGIVKDFDGNKYNTVKIGSQVWTVENLKTTKYNDGAEITNVTSDTQWVDLRTEAYCNYDNLESNAEIYGRLYNWYAVNTGKLAPEGWHVPTDDDWTVLENYLIDYMYNYDGIKDRSKIAKLLCAKTNWGLSGTAGTPGDAPENNNSTSFTALPGGIRKDGDGSFGHIGKSGFWWCSTYGDKESYAYDRDLHYDSKVLHRNQILKWVGCSVRCVKD